MTEAGTRGTWKDLREGVVGMARRSRKGKARKKHKANHGKRPTAR
ncbi:50S ribosomal protein bL37 [Streptosporangium sp. CA-115845]